MVERIGFVHKHDKARNENVCNRHHEHRKQRFTLGLKHVSHDHEVFGITEYLGNPQHAKEPKRLRKNAERRKDGEQIDDGERRERILRERLPPPLPRFEIVGHPPENVVEEQNVHRHHIEHGEHAVLLLEHKRNQTCEGNDDDEDIVCATEGVAWLRALHDFIYAFSHSDR